jgi:hypothetical protein
VTTPNGEPTEKKAEDDKPKPLSRRAKRIFITVFTLGIAALLACFATLVYATTNLNGDNRQGELNAAYSLAADKLRDCKNKVAFAAQSSPPGDLAADRALTQAVAGAYGTSKEIQRDGLLKALNIPVTQPMSTEAFATVLVLTNCQGEYLAAQAAIPPLVESFERWTAEDWFANHTSTRSFPDSRLQVALPDRCVHGTEALALMKRPVAETAMATNWDVKSPMHDSCNNE